MDQLAIEVWFETYLRHSRSLIAESEVDETSTVKGTTEYWRHLTAENVISTLKVRSERFAKVCVCRRVASLE